MVLAALRSGAPSESTRSIASGIAPGVMAQDTVLRIATAWSSSQSWRDELE